MILTTVDDLNSLIQNGSIMKTLELYRSFMSLFMMIILTADMKLKVFLLKLDRKLKSLKHMLMVLKFPDLVIKLKQSTMIYSIE